jgi:hypothetical protein
MMLQCHHIHHRIILTCSYDSLCCPWCIHEINLVHIHAIGVPRIMIPVKSRKAWDPKLESIWELEVQSVEPGGDVGTVREAKPEAILRRLRQALEHYKTPTLQSNYYIYVICIVALSIGVGWNPCCITIIPCLAIWTWILCRQDRIYA